MPDQHLREAAALIAGAKQLIPETRRMLKSLMGNVKDPLGNLCDIVEKQNLALELLKLSIEQKE
jgi:hypothetical protein